MIRPLAALLAAVLLVACHDHGHDRDGHDHGEGEGPEPIAITRWAEGHELFVELDPPRPRQPVAYHAHVTILDGFAPASSGTFTVRFLSGSEVAAEARVEGVARAGIFTPEAPAPPAGTYRLTMTYEQGPSRVTFDCGEITVADEPPAAEPANAAALSFLKEQQWTIPFATAWAEKRSMAREIELPAVIEAPAADQLTLASPTGGRFFHAEGVALAEGKVIAEGTVIGTLAPTVLGDDFSSLQGTLDETRIAEDRARRERARIAPLVKDGLLPEKRLVDVEAELAAASARLKNAQRRLARVVSPGGAGGIRIEATRAGTIAEVLVANGAPVAAGEPLLRLLGDGPLWARSRFVARPGEDFTGAAPVGFRIADRRIALGAGAELLSSQPIVDQRTQLASWTASLGAISTEPRPLKPGMAGVLLVRLGPERERLAVPEAAVTEIDTRPYVFVQTGGESFDKRRVVLGVRDGGFVEVVEGVSPGERVVTRGAFDVHLAAVMGTVASHRH
jgi:membrane fusion protein, heavy metal efflux system